MINLYKVKEGEKVRLNDGRVGVVVENMGDGQWLEVSFEGEDEPELVHSQDIAAITKEEG